MSNALKVKNTFNDSTRVVSPACGLALPEVVNTKIDETPGPRKFLYERLYIRGFVTGTAATGGTGKTSIIDVETIGMALGRNILTNKPLKAGKLKVLMLSLEDSQEEYLRRVKAIKEHYSFSIEEVDIIHQNLFQVFDRKGQLKLLSRVENSLQVNVEVFGYLDEFIKNTEIDVTVIDPLISFHEADENNNIEMQMVLAALRELADRNNIAIHYLHHNRKGADSGADSMRGAVALRDGSRALRMLTRMTTKEAENLNVPANEAGFHIAMTNGKSNFSPATNEKNWFKMVGVNLNNGTKDYQDDVVGVATKWEPPSLFDGFTMEQIKAVWQGIKNLYQEDRRENIQANNWIGKFVAQELNLNPDSDKQRINAMIKKWIDSGVLISEKIKDSKTGKTYPIITFNQAHDLSEQTFK